MPGLRSIVRFGSDRYPSTSGPTADARQENGAATFSASELTDTAGLALLRRLEGICPLAKFKLCNVEQALLQALNLLNAA